ncbi:MAG: hypothetical protein V2I56_02845 [Desulfobacteraceae bacterium]|jgi:pimeloyl-ACP methyl ester carboxylesterase|nr:hypothetical protein [Desulfobacteraceae bacterium]
MNKATKLRSLFIRYVLPCILLVTVLAMCGCATPVGVRRVSANAVYNQIDRSALTSFSYSDYTSVVLRRHGLQAKDYIKDPLSFIRNLHHIAESDNRRDLLLALSELCFLAARKTQADSFSDPLDNRFIYYQAPVAEETPPPVERLDPKINYLASAVYAYLFLLSEGEEPQPGAFDRRFRLACDLYNRSLAKLMIIGTGKIQFEPKTISLPVGQIQLNIKILELPWNPDELETVLSADAFEVYGLSVRNRIPGLGAPIMAVRKKQPGKPVSSAVPATIFLEVKGGIADIDGGNCIGDVSILSTASERAVTVGNQKIPLEIDLTAPIAYSFNDPVLWSLGRNLLRFGRSPFKPGIYPLHPYEPDLIPVVLVHGTMSSPVWWSEMLNTLMSDPRIRGRFQIWLYLYDSGKPVVFSAQHLRDSIKKMIRVCDPEGHDDALKNIVIIGHSQGGLLTRMTALETGDTIIKAATGKTLDELDLSPKDREVVTQYAVFHPLPEVRRVIFIATPHRGSIIAGSFARRIALWLITLPRQVVQAGNEMLHITEQFSVAGKVKWSISRTSIDSMSPDNPGLLAMAELPFPPGVKGHSIIAIKGNKQPPEGDDGVVSYKSAHLDGVESERVVPYGHSCQMEPIVIEEVRRILIEHLTN